MDSGGKQRVIGACVLVAIGVLFLPVLLDRNEERVIDTTSQIPAKPNFTLYEHKAPTKPANAAPPPGEETLFLPEQEAANSPAPDPDLAPIAAPSNTTAASAASQNTSHNGLDPDGLPKSWVVQVASFTDENRAKSLVQALLDDNYRAYFRRVVRTEKSLYRVYVGPNIDRDAALKLKDRLDTKLNADTLVLRLAP